ncbi:hypothetical protein QFZ99_005102 [Paraburkholderia atlantica]|uniref:Uncharacterized protein n=1 Tax=Paraburkholderia atlantica TaxID=2654982 RepID=A0A7W8Q3P3_PARAM|nr:hypothetical protein [Paraburkholderia atlantica]
MAMVKQGDGASRSFFGHVKCVAVFFRRESMGTQYSQPLMLVSMSDARV